MRDPRFPAVTTLVALLAAVLVPAALPPIAFTSATCHAAETATPTAVAPAASFPFVMPWDDATPGTVTDLSALNAKPAGVHGRIVARDGHFFEAGTGDRVRFFGINFTNSSSIFPSHADATKIAAHVAKLGFNVVRIHHHDNNGSPLWDKTAPGHHTFNPVSVDRLDFLIAELKKAGVYVDLNLHVSRTFTAADGFPESVSQLPGIFNKRVDNFDAHMIALQKDFARDYLTHINPYTGLTYTADPCVAFVEISNEDSLVDWDSAAGRFDYFQSLPEPFRGDLLAKWNHWLAGRYGTDKALQVAWDGKVAPDDGTLAAGTLGVPTAGTAAARADWVRFLVETERQYADEMRRYLREELKVGANITDSQQAYGELSSFNREAGSDFADEHAYWQHPEFPGKQWDAAHWTMGQTSMVTALAGGASKALSRLATHRVAGKPYTVSEYCVPAPNDYQAEMYPLIASYAALQDWDAIYHFDYGDYGEGKPAGRIQSFFAMNGNPLKESYAAAAALLFRRGEISPLQSSTTLRLAKDASWRAGRIEVEWGGANGGRKPDLLAGRLLVAPDQGTGTSDLVNTPAAVPETSSARIIQAPAGAGYVAQGEGAVALAGFVGGAKVATPKVTLEFPTFGNNYAALILASADGKALQNSGRLLLTIGGNGENIGMGWNAERTSVGNQWGTGPTQVEGIPATVTLNNALVRHVWALDPTGARGMELPAQRAGQRVTFAVGPQYQTLCYELSQ